jgi:hypothetical protein
LLDSAPRRAWIASFALYILTLIATAPFAMLGYSQQWHSIEGFWIALTRYIAQNWSNLDWCPLWYSGMPLQNVYQSGLPIVCAFFHTVTGMPPERAYHVATWLIFAVGPPGLGLLAWRVTKCEWRGWMTGLLWLLWSPSVWMFRYIRHDVESKFNGRRFQVIAEYGETPNGWGLSLTPWAWLALYEAWHRRTPLSFFVAALAVAAVIITSIPAALVMVVGVVCFILSQHWRQWWPVGWRLGLAGLCGYALIMPWFWPITMQQSQINSQFIEGNFVAGAPQHFARLAIVGAMLLVAWLTWKWQLIEFARWMAIFTVPFSVITIAGHTSLWILPQPVRFHLAMEIGLVALGALFLVHLAERFSISNRARWIVLAMVIPPLTFSHWKAISIVSKAPDLANCVEFQAAKWLEANHPKSRVFATGSVSFYLATFSEVPATRGCCEPASLKPIDFMFPYVVATADGTGDQYGYISQLWLKAMGAEFVVAGQQPGSGDAYKIWPRGAELQLSMRKVWQAPGSHDFVLQTGLKNVRWAHVVPAKSVPTRTPRNGIDLEPLVPYVAALDSEPAEIASMSWSQTNRARIQAQVKPGEVISVQTTYHPGWRATTSNIELAVGKDALGHILLDPGPGKHEIDLIFDGGKPLQQAQLARALAVLALAIYGITDWSGRRRKLRQKID